METKMIDVSLITVNEGQVEGLPRNPRLVRKERYEATKRSIEESPEMLSLRELIVVEHGPGYVVVCGNLRLRACADLGHREVPCKVLPADTPAAKLREYAEAVAAHRTVDVTYTDDARPLDNFEQRVDERVFCVPLRYRSVAEGLAATFATDTGPDV